ncbi:LysR substrate-binding domain-containing protein [Achromobacter xylosoxidans]
MRIKALENQLNTRLLYRDSRGVEITPAGQRLLQHARVILRQVDHLKHDFQEQADGDAGHIRIFANTTAVTEFMPDLLARYLAGHPGVTVDLQERLTRDIVRGVRDGTTDLGIVAGPVDAPELQAIHFSTDRLVLVTPNGHPLQDRAKVKLTEAVSYPFITMHEGSTLVAFLREQLEMAGQRLPQRIQLYSFDSICRMVQAGVGVGVIPDSARTALRRQPGPARGRAGRTLGGARAQAAAARHRRPARLRARADRADTGVARRVRRHIAGDRYRASQARQGAPCVQDRACHENAAQVPLTTGKVRHAGDPAGTRLPTRAPTREQHPGSDTNPR